MRWRRPSCGRKASKCVCACFFLGYSFAKSPPKLQKSFLFWRKRTIPQNIPKLEKFFPRVPKVGPRMAEQMWVRSAHLPPARPEVNPLVSKPSKGFPQRVKRTYPVPVVLPLVAMGQRQKLRATKGVEKPRSPREKWLAHVGTFCEEREWLTLPPQSTSQFLLGSQDTSKLMDFSLASLFSNQRGPPKVCFFTNVKRVRTWQTQLNTPR